MQPLRTTDADTGLMPHAAAVNDKASPTKGLRMYDALKAKRWHPDFRLQDVSVAKVCQSLAAARRSPLWAAGGKKAPSTAAIASMIRRLTMSVLDREAGADLRMRCISCAALTRILEQRY